VISVGLRGRRNEFRRASSLDRHASERRIRIRDLARAGEGKGRPEDPKGVRFAIEWLLDGYSRGRLGAPR